jgi:hypothetical protein
MTLPLSPQMVEALYEYFCTTPPFNKMKMPPGKAVKFVVGKATDCFAYYQWDGSKHTITVSSRAVAHTITLAQSLSHEMIHLWLYTNKKESKRGGASYHNSFFKKIAARVCRYHGFDPKAFY